MKNILSFILSILLLLSSTGITYAEHYCGDLKMMEKITFGKEQLSCRMAMVDDGCGDEDKQDEEHDCCDNQYTNISTDDNFTQAFFNMQLVDTFVPAFVAVFVLEQMPVSNATIPQFSEYNPPPLLKDIPVLYETFLI